MTKDDQKRSIDKWIARRRKTDGGVLVATDGSTWIKRAMKPHERKFFEFGVIPDWHVCANDNAHG